MSEDISNKTIVVLVVLTVVISMLGTLIVLNEVNNIQTNPAKGSAEQTKSTTQGEVKFIVSPEEKNERSLATGKIIFEVSP